MMTPSTPPPEQQTPPPLRHSPQNPTSRSNTTLTNTTLIVVLVVLSTLIFNATASVLQPFAVAVFFCYLVFPLVRLLLRIGFPRLVAYVTATTAFFVAIYALGHMLALNVQAFVDQIPAYTVKISSTFSYLESIGERWGILESGETLTFRHLVLALPEGALANLIGDSTSSFITFAGNLVLVAFFMLFILLEVDRLFDRIQMAYGEQRALDLIGLIQDINTSVEQYLLLKVVVSLLTALLSIVLMASFGLNLFLLWGVLVFVLNFIPYFGSIVATLLPTVMAFLQFDSAWKAVWLGGLLVVVQNGIGNVVEPALQGRNLNVSPLVILVALTFWGWLWGIVGMLLAVPIIVSIRIILEHFPTVRPYAILMSNAHAVDRNRKSRFTIGRNSKREHKREATDD